MAKNWVCLLTCPSWLFWKKLRKAKQKQNEFFGNHFENVIFQVLTKFSRHFYGFPLIIVFYNRIFIDCWILKIETSLVQGSKVKNLWKLTKTRFFNCIHYFKKINLTFRTLYQEMNSRKNKFHSLLKILFFVEGFDKNTKVLESLEISWEHIQELFFTIM